MRRIALEWLWGCLFDFDIGMDLKSVHDWRMDGWMAGYMVAWSIGDGWTGCLSFVND